MDAMSNDAAGRISAEQTDTLRKQIAFITRDGRYRTVITDSESADGIALVCTSPQHIEYDAQAMSEPSAPPPEDGTGASMYDCCDPGVIETHHEILASFFVDALAAIPALLAERDALAADLDCTRQLLHAFVPPVTGHIVPAASGTGAAA